MALIEWNDGLSVGVAAMDHQHKKLVDMVNRFYDAMHYGKGDELILRTLRELAEYTRTHFTAEEALMRNVRYPHLPGHQELHANLVNQVAILLQNVQAGKTVASVSIATFLKDWLITHIGKQDREYGRFIGEQQSARRHRPSAENTHTVKRQYNQGTFHHKEKHMFKTMKLGSKLVLGFSAVACITLVLGIMGYYGAVKSGAAIEDIGGVRLPAVRSAVTIAKHAQGIRGTVRTLAVPGLSKDVRERQYENLSKAREHYEAAWAVYETLPHTPEEARLWEQFVPAWNAWRTENNKAIELCRQFDQLGIENPDLLKQDLETFRGDHYRLEAKVLQMFRDNEAFEGGESHTDCAFGRWLASFQVDNTSIRQAMQTCGESHRQFHESVRRIKQLVQEGKLDEARDFYSNAMVPAAEKTFAALRDMRTTADQALSVIRKAQEQILGPVTTAQAGALDLLDKIERVNAELAETEVSRGHTQAAFLEVFSLVAMVVGVLLAMVLGILITRSITKPINRVILGLTEGAEQVTSAAQQVSAASQSLAEGATEQAAGLEETSSSLEEMASQTRQNAENAQQASVLSEEAKKAADNGAEAMARMNQAIQEIQMSSDETAKIIKVIDEIAFQTNLLALNAAVEAARAGEAGKGFAVVAEEVRNLAMRSAEAAKNTSEMIEGSVKNAQNGVQLAEEVSGVLNEIVASVSKTRDLIGEIAAASQEQSQGIDQVNQAVGQMDKVTQANAANAEESASAAEELNAQAEELNRVVGELSAMVGGSTGQAGGYGGSASGRPTPRRKPRLSASDHAFHQIAKGSGSQEPAHAPARQIPLSDEETFDEFNR